MSFENTAFYAAVEALVYGNAIDSYDERSQAEQLIGFLSAARCDAGSIASIIYNGDVAAFLETHLDAICDVIADMDSEGYGLSASDLIEALRGDAWRIVYPAVDQVMALMLSDIEADAEAAE